MVFFPLSIEQADKNIAEIVEKAKIPKRTVDRIIARLKEKELIERSGANKGGYWKVSE